MEGRRGESAAPLDVAWEMGANTGESLAADVGETVWVFSLVGGTEDSALALEVDGGAEDVASRFNVIRAKIPVLGG